MTAARRRPPSASRAIAARQVSIHAIAVSHVPRLCAGSHTPAGPLRRLSFPGGITSDDLQACSRCGAWVEAGQGR